MFDAPDSPFLVPFDERFRVADMSTSPDPDVKSDNKRRLRNASKRLDVLQQALLAADICDKPDCFGQNDRR